MNLLLQGPHINGILQYLSFCDWPFSLSTMSSKFIMMKLVPEFHFWGWVIFNCVYIIHFAYPFIYWWHWVVWGALLFLFFLKLNAALEAGVLGCRVVWNIFLAAYGWVRCGWTVLPIGLTLLVCVQPFSFELSRNRTAGMAVFSGDAYSVKVSVKAECLSPSDLYIEALTPMWLCLEIDIGENYKDEMRLWGWASIQWDWFQEEKERERPCEHSRRAAACGWWRALSPETNLLALSPGTSRIQNREKSKSIV